MRNRKRPDEKAYMKIVDDLARFFRIHDREVRNVRRLAREIHDRLDEISPFVENVTRRVCPSCRDVCCISEHGFYSSEDIVYMYALGLEPPLPDFSRNDSDPCRFLSANGCVMARRVRPSGCNWYFCESLFDNMETQRDYQMFDDALAEIAALWLKMVEEFSLLRGGNVEL
ncbi:MAG: hypothetical protein AB1442_02520 [Nitrospirota bacterium]